MEKNYIRIQLINVNESNLAKSFNAERGDKYKTDIDSGFEDLNLKDDIGKLQLYLQSELLTLNNGKYYKVIERIFQPSKPCMLIIKVEEIELI